MFNKIAFFSSVNLKINKNSQNIIYLVVIEIKKKKKKGVRPVNEDSQFHRPRNIISCLTIASVVAMDIVLIYKTRSFALSVHSPLYPSPLLRTVNEDSQFHRPRNIISCLTIVSVGAMDIVLLDMTCGGNRRRDGGLVYQYTSPSTPLPFVHSSVCYI